MDRRWTRDTERWMLDAGQDARHTGRWIGRELECMLDLNGMLAARQDPGRCTRDTGPELECMFKFDIGQVVKANASC